MTLASSNKPYGVVTPLAVIGICMKVFGIVISIVIGVSLGGMPIIGFNMGAGNINRVKQTIKYITKNRKWRFYYDLSGFSGYETVCSRHGGNAASGRQWRRRRDRLRENRRDGCLRHGAGRQLL